jgi:hypothetical protein
MKNALITLFCLSTYWANAQTPDSLKASSKHFSTELNVNPFYGGLGLNNALQQIKIRYMVSDQVALRLAFNVNSKKNDSEKANPYGTMPTRNEVNKKSSVWGISLGTEKHFKGTKRLSPYIGAELGIASKTSSHKIIDNKIETTIEGAWQVNSSTPYGGANYEERSFFRYGLNLITGFDFYVAKNFFLGYEFAFQYNITKYKDIDVYTKGEATPSSIGDSNYADKDSFVGPSLMNGIRVGFVF